MKGHGRRALAAAEGAALHEIRRLEQIFSVYLSDSELNRWRHTSADSPAGPELARLLRSALHWQLASAGAFNPAVGAISDRWKTAQGDGMVPSADELATLAESMRLPRYDEDLKKIGDCSSLNFNAFAKGFIADLTCRHLVQRRHITAAMVNIGGDLAHLGDGTVEAAIEHPERAYENAVPLTHVRLSNQGLATSGSTRRGFQVGEQRFGHVIDPRSGRPVETIRSVSVIADDAATADVVATVLGVAPVDHMQSLGTAYGYCIVTADGMLRTNDAWRASAHRQPDEDHADD